MLKNLLDKLRKKDSQSERILFEMFYPKIYNIAWFITKDPHLAQDVVQETFLKAFGQMHTLKDANKLEAWLASIATRTALDFLRQTKRRIDFASEDVYRDERIFEHEFQLPVEKIVEDNIVRQTVREELAQLKPEDKQILVLKYGYDLKDQEIADTLQISVGAVKTRVRRAKARLKLALEKRLYEGNGEQNGDYPQAQSR